ncbi:hypothetical protein WICPIJ_001886 [Wickerhamomyces pijperi]|uniref:Uncharacterized protein n=1 Tax=Wickerhamomyces pijperi TaxID=599730 RepID=A0A9P8QAV3_WICPI|nr:hypothetical protein WICPIJ_001886 [Wickerhamomyces pijperi]
MDFTGLEAAGSNGKLSSSSMLKFSVSSSSISLVMSSSSASSASESKITGWNNEEGEPIDFSNNKSPCSEIPEPCWLFVRTKLRFCNCDVKDKS